MGETLKQAAERIGQTARHAKGEAHKVGKSLAQEAAKKALPRRPGRQAE